MYIKENAGANVLQQAMKQAELNIAVVAIVKIKGILPIFVSYRLLVPAKL